MRKLILILFATLTASAGCCRFCDDRDRRYYTPASRTAPVPLTPVGR